MTDLRTAAQAVIDEYSKHGLMMVGYDSGQIALAKLRKALAEPVEPVATIFFSGPIGYFWVDTLEMGERILHYMKVDDDDWTAKNTTPPSVDALIAEAVAKEREACAELCDAIAGNPKDFFEQFRRGAGRCAADIRARGQK